MDPISLAIILYLLAIGLAFLDVFVPSGGLLVVLAAAAAVGCILFGFRAGTTAGMVMLTLVAASIPALAALAIRIWPKTPIGKRIVLGLPKTSPEINKVTNPLQEFIGKVVVAEYPLMPAGQITIDHIHINAHTESGYIDAGEKVEVIGVRERNLIVRTTSKTLSPRSNRILGRATQALESEASVKNDSLLDVPAEELGLNSLED